MERRREEKKWEEVTPWRGTPFSTRDGQINKESKIELPYSSLQQLHSLDHFPITNFNGDQEEGFLPSIIPYKGAIQKRDENEYCSYHRDHGHNTKDYHHLK